MHNRIADSGKSIAQFELATTEIWSVDPSVLGMIKLPSGVTLLSDEMGKNYKIAF